MRKMKLLVLGVVMVFSLTSCGLLDSLPTVFDVEEEGADFDIGALELPEISIEDFVETDSDSVTEEEKDAQYKEYLLGIWQELLENQEGIKDIDLNFEDIADGEKLNVDIDFEALVGDKEAIKEEITAALEMFFADFENLTIDIQEE